MKPVKLDGHINYWEDWYKWQRMLQDDFDKQQELVRKLKRENLEEWELSNKLENGSQSS